MPKKLARIQCRWSNSGHISYRISKGYASPTDNRDLLLAPSLPFLISHQLGSFRPSHGLILCSQVLRFYTETHHTMFPINSALKGADIQYVQTSQGTLITFHPKHRLLVNNDSLEEGVRQFVNNYARFVNDQISGDTFLIVRGIVGSVLDGYLNILDEKITKGLIGPSSDLWSADLPLQMASASLMVGEIYGPTFPSDVDRGHVENTFNEKSSQLQAKYHELSRKMGIEA